MVDRELDIAISQFAPSSETVKDGMIYTAVGVVDYQPQGNSVVEQPNPLGPQVPIGLCHRCQAVDGSQNPAQACPVCGAAPPDYDQVILSQPRGFRTWFGADRDFDGVFEWTARASRPKVGVTPITMTPVANFNIWSGQDTVYVINDNDGRQFDFEKLAQGETWVTRDALAKIGVNSPTLAPGGAPDRRVLASVKPTDVLVLSIQTWPAGVTAVPLRVEGRASLYSLGFLFRRAAAVRLDIHERELKVGLRVMQDPNGQVVGQIFISDSLENGAGYSSYFGTPAESESLLRFVVGQTSDSFYGPLVAQVDPHGNQLHGAMCRTSCPDCLRDFSNLAYHNILDWRLGLDLARLALDLAAPIDFSVSYWQGLDAAAAGPYFAAMPGWQQVTFGGLQAGRRGNQVEIVTHPLWNTDPNLRRPAARHGLCAGGRGRLPGHDEVHLRGTAKALLTVDLPEVGGISPTGGGVRARSRAVTAAVTATLGHVSSTARWPVIVDLARGHAQRQPPQREHATDSQRRHGARDPGQTLSASPRPSVPAPSRGPARSSRLGLSGSAGLCVRARLFLARLSFVRRRHAACEVATSILGSEDPGQPQARRATHGGVAPSRVARVRHLGMRVGEPNDTEQAGSAIASAAR